MYILFHFLNSDYIYTHNSLQIFYRAGNNWFYYDIINLKLTDSNFEDTLCISCSLQVSDYKKLAKEKKCDFSH